MPVILEAAINGSTPKRRNPAVPRTPAEVALDALACLEAGATIVHHHTDDPNVGGPARHDAAPYVEAYEKILTAVPDALLYPTMAGGNGGRTAIEDRYAHLVELHERGLLPMALADPGSFSIAGVGPDGHVAATPWVYENTSADYGWMLRRIATWGLPVSCTIFEPGHLRLVLAHHDAGTLPPGVVLGLCFGGPRSLVGLPPTERSLDAYLAMLDGHDLAWVVRVIGGDVVGCGLARAAIERGGHVRVGLEDDDRADVTNVEVVTAAVAEIEAGGRRVATRREALELLGTVRS